MGVQWKELIDHHSLYVPSLSSLATGPVHSNVSATTLDYVIGNSTLPDSCKTMGGHPLNTCCYCQPQLSPHLPAFSENYHHLDWEHACSGGSTSSNTSLVDDLVKPLLVKDYLSIHEIDSDISKSLHTIAASTMLSRKPNRNTPCIYAAHLSTLCWCAQDAFLQWKAAGCLRSYL